MEPTTSALVAERMASLLGEFSYMDEADRDAANLTDADLFQDAAIRSYAEAGVLTRDDGLVVRLADGAEYQITIVKSR